MSVKVLHFWSPTCNPCRVIKPALDDVKEEFEGRIEWFSINIKDDHRNTAMALQVTVVPTIVVFKGDTEIGRYSGTQMTIIYALIRKGLSMA